jgi:predicted pyridoxine 5'-phosphate oxidase superfamily flavin-nucleotide-binding protein
MNQKFSFHPGELAVQQRAHQAAVAARNMGLMSDAVMPGARPFIAQQFMVVLSSVDAAGRLWSSLVFGQPGFLHTDDARTIMVDVPAAARDRSDPLWDALAVGADLGMLFIELGTRRRFRVNGTVQRNDAHGLAVQVREAFPVCPKYIQRRHLRNLGDTGTPPERAADSGSALSDAARDIIRRADTFFVASHHAEAGADASSRGGHPGFAQIIDQHTLRIPDFHGNSMFNTMGNLQLDPRAGLCFPDFERQRLLQLTGEAVLHWDQNDPHNQTGGTGRFWEFKIDQWLLRTTPQQLEWEYLDASPFIPGAALPQEGSAS